MNRRAPAFVALLFAACTDGTANPDESSPARADLVEADRVVLGDVRRARPAALRSARFGVRATRGYLDGRDDLEIGNAEDLRSWAPVMSTPTSGHGGITWEPIPPARGPAEISALNERLTFSVSDGFVMG